MSRMASRASMAVLAACAAWGCESFAQVREGQPVWAPAPAPTEPAPQDIVPLFSEFYRASGSPRIVLLWNREFGDQAQSAVIDKRVTRESGSSSANSLEKTSQGATDSAVLKDASNRFDRSKTVTATTTLEADPKRAITLAERHAASLQRAFVGEMNRGGVLFVDRALVMRMTAASQHRAGGDPRLIETDALLARADMLLEILMIEDKDAPSGYAFDVRAKDLKQGAEVASVYSRAVPPAPRRTPGAWVAGKDDYEFRTPPPPPAHSSPAQVGAALARDVMYTLGTSLESAARKAAARSAAPTVPSPIKRK